MRPPVTGAKIEKFMSALGLEVTGPGSVFFTGGVTALLHGWRDTTIDIDIKAMPEPAGFFQAIALLKEREAVNMSWPVRTILFRRFPAGGSGLSLSIAVEVSTSITTILTRRLWRKSSGGTSGMWPTSSLWLRRV
jgi:hypothetical protein